MHRLILLGAAYDNPVRARYMTSNTHPVAFHTAYLSDIYCSIVLDLQSLSVAHARVSAGVHASKAGARIPPTSLSQGYTQGAVSAFFALLVAISVTTTTTTTSDSRSCTCDLLQAVVDAEIGKGKTNPMHMVKAFYRQIHWGCTGIFQDVSAPVLVLVGASDQLTPLAQATKVVAALRHAHKISLKVIPLVGTWHITIAAHHQHTSHSANPRPR